MRSIRLQIAGAAALSVAAVLAVPGTQGAVASTKFGMGVPTVVDPIRGVGEPDIAVYSTNQPFISGPGGSSTQTSFFWGSRDGGQSFYLHGPHNGHWVCSQLGGGDSLNVVDRTNDDMYIIDQESLADLGLSKIDGKTGQMSSQCLNAPGITADRPFLAVVNGKGAPQVKADGGKSVTYLSWQCNGCGGATQNSLEQLPTDAQNQATPGSGLAFGWTDDGVHYHPAEPGTVDAGTGTPADKVTDSAQSSSVIFAYSWHGNMVADPVTGDVFTAISCGGSCPNFSAGNEFGVAVGIPPASPSASDVGQWDKLYYQTAANHLADGSAMPSGGSLFPVIAMDSARTLYEAWIQGNGGGLTPSQSLAIDPTDWHLYYTYSTCDAADGCTHTKWSKPITVDHGADTPTSTFGWMTAGDKGKLGFVWLGSKTRENPSQKNADKVWYPFTAITVNGDTANPTFQQDRLGVYPNHLNDICLRGTACAVADPYQKALGNRNMADFLSADIGPDGALQVTYADDANNLATLPSSLLPGLPVTMYARQVSGPRLVGSGDVQDTRFSTTPSSGVSDPTGDALYPVDGGGTNVPQLDLTGASATFDGTNLHVHIGVNSLASLASPDTSDQVNVWWLASWKFQDHLYFAKAEVDGGGTPIFKAGTPSSYDRPGICMCTAPTLVDYSGGTAVDGTQSANGWDITVPANLVGGPSNAADLGSFGAYTMLDNGKPLIVSPAANNMPSIVDATPATNLRLLAPGGAPMVNSAVTPGSSQSGSGSSNQPTTAAVSTPNTSGVSSSARVAGIAVIAVAAAVLLGRRRRASKR